MVPFLLLPLAAITLGLVTLFDFRGWRTAALHPGMSHEEFLRQRPSRRVFLIIFGGLFLSVGLLTFFGLIAGMVIMASRR
jgi:hypothetical protein